MDYSEDLAHLRANGRQPGEPGPDSTYDPAKGYGPRIRDLAQAGEFPEVWAAACGVTKQTLRDWCAAHPDFQEDMVTAFGLLEAFWSRLPLWHLTNPDLRSSVLMETLRKRFPSPWSKVEAQDMRAEFGLASRAEGPLTPEQKARRMSDAGLNARAEELLERYQRRKEEGQTNSL